MRAAPATKPLSGALCHAREEWPQRTRDRRNLLTIAFELRGTHEAWLFLPSRWGLINSADGVQIASTWLSRGLSAATLPVTRGALLHADGLPQCRWHASHGHTIHRWGSQRHPSGASNSSFSRVSLAFFLSTFGQFPRQLAHLPRTHFSCCRVARAADASQNGQRGVQDDSRCRLHACCRRAVVCAARGEERCVPPMTLWRF